MRVGEIYKVTLGVKYSDKYLVTGNTADMYHTLRRVRTPKSKIDDVRLPSMIFIEYFGSAVPQSKQKSKH